MTLRCAYIERLHLDVEENYPDSIFEIKLTPTFPTFSRIEQPLLVWLCPDMEAGDNFSVGEEIL